MNTLSQGSRTKDWKASMLSLDCCSCGQTHALVGAAGCCCQSYQMRQKDLAMLKQTLSRRQGQARGCWRFCLRLSQYCGLHNRQTEPGWKADWHLDTLRIETRQIGYWTIIFEVILIKGRFLKEGFHNSSFKHGREYAWKERLIDNMRNFWHNFIMPKFGMYGLGMSHARTASPKLSF